MKRDIIKVFMTNIIKMCVTLITTFIIPIVLSVEQYGLLKEYQLYASYIGIAHLGFCDGVYLQYGGKDKNKLNKNNISKIRCTLFWYELLVAVLFIIFGITVDSVNIIGLGITIVPTLMFTLYTCMYQAVGDFDSYTRIMNFSSIINLLENLALILLGVKDYRVFVLTYAFSMVVISMFGFLSFKKDGWNNWCFPSVEVFIKYVRLGFLLTVGNFVYAFFLSIDKWFIKYSMTINDFSMYSFAAQIVTVVNMIISPIAMTLYSNMSARKDKEFEKKIGRVLLCIICVIPLGIYVIDIIINLKLQKYVNSKSIISVLLIMQMFLCLNTAVFVNLYKVYKKQNEYFSRLLGVIIVSIALDGVVLLIKPNTISYAVVSCITVIIWIIINIEYFPHMKPKKETLLYVILLLSVYGCLWFISSEGLRFIIYGISYIMLTKVLMNDVWKYGVQTIWQFKNIIRRK